MLRELPRTNIPILQVNNINNDEIPFKMSPSSPPRSPSPRSPSSTSIESPEISPRVRESNFSNTPCLANTDSEWPTFSPKIPQTVSQNFPPYTNNTTSIAQQQLQELDEEKFDNFFKTNFSFLNLTPEAIKHSKALISLLSSIAKNLPQIPDNLAFTINSIFSGDSIGFINAENIEALEKTAKKLANEKLADYCTKYRVHQANNNSQIKYLKV